MPLVKLTLYKKNGKKVVYPFSDRIKRLTLRASQGKYERCHIYCSYGRKLDYKNKLRVFYNEVYTTKENAADYIRYFFYE